MNENEIVIGSVGLVKPEIFHFDKPLALSCGRVLPNFDLIYETYGSLNSKKSNAILLGFACLIDRSEKKTLKIKKKKIISQIKLKIPTYKEKNLPESLKRIPITKPGSRFIK